MERLNSYISDLRAKATNAQQEAAHVMAKEMMSSLFPANSRPGFLVPLETDDGSAVQGEG